MAGYQFATAEGLKGLLQELGKSYTIFVPEKRGEHRLYRRWDSTAGQAPPEGGTSAWGSAAMCLGEVRAYEPLKSFYFQARKKVAENFEDRIPGDGGKPLCLVGVKACDLKGFAVLDRVFQGHDYVDPFYAKARRENLIVSADCTCALEVCFCLALGGAPYPQEGFDINLSELSGGHLVEAGSERGSRLLEEGSAFLQPAGEQQLREREARRAEVTEAVRHNIREHGVPDQDALAGAIRRNYEAPLWREEAATCVECGACNAVCPTCHCFQLFDQTDGRRLARFRIWDSCLIKDFARVAGGANPRPYLWMRLRNRFEKKFDFFPAVEGIYACTGCGRCILACPGKIDIRRVLERNTEHV